MEVEKKENIKRPKEFPEGAFVPVAAQRDVDTFLIVNNMAHTTPFVVDSYRRDFEIVYQDSQDFMENEMVNLSHLEHISGIQRRIERMVVHNLAVASFVNDFMKNWLSKEEAGEPLPPLTYPDTSEIDPGSVLLDLQKSPDRVKNAVWLHFLRAKGLAEEAAESLRKTANKYRELWYFLSKFSVTTGTGA